MLAGLSIFHLIGLTKPCGNPECDREFPPRFYKDNGRMYPALSMWRKQRFCSATCRQSQHGLSLEIDGILMTCAASHCDNTFKKKGKKKYCSIECKDKPDVCVSCEEVRVSRGKELCRSCAMSDPEFSKSMSRKIKEKWNDPEYRSRRELTEQSSETKQRRIKAGKFRWENPEYREKMSNLAKRRWRSADFRKWIDEYYDEERRTLISHQSRERWQSPEFREKMFLNNYLPYANPNVIYPSGYTRIRPTILYRAMGLCEYCGNTHTNMDVHHIDHDKKNNHPYNLIVLCRPCHLHYGHTDIGRHDSPELGAGFESIAHKRSLAMPLGWWEEVSEVLDYAEKWEESVAKRDK